MTLILWFHILSEKTTGKSKNKYQFKSDSKDKNEKKNIENKIQSLSFICVLLLLKVHIRLFNVHKRFANYNMIQIVTRYARSSKGNGKKLHCERKAHINKVFL